MAAESQDNDLPTPRVGLLTRTIVQSPVIRWIIPARIRHRKLDDVVFVGDDFVQIKQVKRGGHLLDVHTHNTFGSRICAASALDIDGDLPKEDTFLQQELTDSESWSATAPAQLLVLTLESQTLLFAYLQRQADGHLLLKTQPIPLPRWPAARLQVSHHLNVDPSSRALAVAAMEEHIIVWSTKTPAQIRVEIEQGSENWCPLTIQQPVRLGGIISHITFLRPAQTDSGHIILLAIVVDKRRTRLVWYDWWHTSELSQMQSHDILVVESPRCAPSMVIPLSRANFALVHGNTISICKDILSGFVEQIVTEPIDLDHPADHPAVSSRRPEWSGWCRPMRNLPSNDNRDFLYLSREDGKVFLLEVADADVTSSFAGDLHCYVGQAFASLGNDLEPDLLAIAGECSIGQIACIGDWSQRHHRLSSRETALQMDVVELLPNWAPLTDAIVTSSTSEKHAKRSQESLVVSGGRQPYASITEIRTGLEAQIMTYASLENARGVNAIWALTNAADNDVILLLSTFESTIILRFSSETDAIEPVDDSALQTAHSTLAADVISPGYIVQVTPAAITVTTSLHARFDDHNTQHADEHSSYLFAAIEPEAGIVLCAQRSGDGFVLITYFLHQEAELADFLASTRSLPEGVACACVGQPLAMATASAYGSTYAALATSDGSLRLYSCQDTSLEELTSIIIPSHNENCCESLGIMTFKHEHRQPNNGVHHEYWLKIVCGLRNGSIFSCTVLLEQPCVVINQHICTFGQEPVTIVRHSSRKNEIMAFSGSDTCLISLHPDEHKDLDISQVWLTDKIRPDLVQGRLSAYTRMPPPDRLPRSSILGTLGAHAVFLSGSDLNFVHLAEQISTVPMQIAAGGSPTRLLYAQWHKCWVSAAMYCELNTSNSHTSRKVYPVIDFISARNTSKRKSFALDPGDEVYALLEWTHRAIEDKLHSIILVGGLCDAPRNPRGRISFLRPDMHKTDTGVHASRPLMFDAPVYALALYDTLTFIACHGTDVSAFQFDAKNRKWRKLCESFRLSSRGSVVSCNAPWIYITTSSDGIVCLALKERSNAQASFQCDLVPLSASPCAALGVSHLAVDGTDDAGLIMMSTKDRRLLGMSLVKPDLLAPGHPASLEIAFEVNLKQSIIRLRRGDFRPRWKQKLPQGVLTDNVVGACTDGSVIGLFAIDEMLWRRLFWLQRLIEWSSNSIGAGSMYETVDDNVLGEARDLPIGLGSGHSTILLYSPYGHRNKGGDMHIDGDLLAAFLRHGGSAAVHALVMKAAQRQDDVGSWMREHLEAETAAIAECVLTANSVLDAWT